MVFTEETSMSSEESDGPITILPLHLATDSILLHYSYSVYFFSFFFIIILIGFLTMIVIQRIEGKDVRLKNKKVFSMKLVLKMKQR